MRTSLLTFCALTLAAFAACSDDDPPAPAAGADAAPEASTTSDSGTTAETSTTTDAATGTPKAFGETCTADAECQSNACFVGGKESYCSTKCTKATQATDCPKPLTSGECNNQGFCKKP